MAKSEKKTTEDNLEKPVKPKKTTAKATEKKETDTVSVETTAAAPKKTTAKSAEKKTEPKSTEKKAPVKQAEKIAEKPAAKPKTGKPVSMKKDESIGCTGRRKKAVARVRFVKGTGKIIVNNKPVNEYFPGGVYEMIIRQPLEVTSFKNDYDIKVNVYGGGLSGQAGAIRLGVSRALDIIDPSNHSALKANDFFTRDPRMVERKKFGRKKARKRFQFSKR